jgi:hypothetical protein
MKNEPTQFLPLRRRTLKHNTCVCLLLNLVRRSAVVWIFLFQLLGLVLFAALFVLIYVQFA